MLTNRKEPHRKGKIQLIDARNHWVPMEKSLGNKRRRIGDPSTKESDPDHIGAITAIHTAFAHDASTTLPVRGNGDKTFVVSKVFANADFGYRKITVERPLRDEKGQVVISKRGKSKGQPEADSNLRDTETVPLTESVEAYFAREVLPHVSDAWIDHEKTKIGYEIPLNRHFYVYEPPRPLEAIQADIVVLEKEIVALLKEVTA